MLQVPERAVRAVGVALVLANVQEQARRRGAAEDAVGALERVGVRMGRTDCDAGEADVGLDGARPVHDLRGPGAQGAGIRYAGDRLAAAPARERLLDEVERPAGPHVADDDHRGFARLHALGVHPRDGGARDLLHGRGRRQHRPVGMLPEHAPAHGFLRERLRIAARDLDLLQDAVALDGDFVLRVDRVRQDLGEQREIRLEVRREHGTADGQRVGGRTGVERRTEPLQLDRDLHARMLRRPRRERLDQQLGRAGRRAASERDYQLCFDLRHAGFAHGVEAQPRTQLALGNGGCLQRARRTRDGSRQRHDFGSHSRTARVSPRNHRAAASETPAGVTLRRTVGISLMNSARPRICSSAARSVVRPMIWSTPARWAAVIALVTRWTSAASTPSATFVISSSMVPITFDLVFGST